MLESLQKSSSVSYIYMFFLICPLAKNELVYARVDGIPHLNIQAFGQVTGLGI